MTKIKRFFAILLAVMLVAFIGAGGALVAFADTADGVPETSQETVGPDISSDETSLDAFVEQFKQRLKDKYGADYEYYYNEIIEQWGSVEAYLLALGEKLPEEYKTGWDKFVGWLDEYSVLWAPALAVCIVILVAVTGKKQFNKIVEKIVNGKLSPIVSELNLQSGATLSIMHAQKALLGNGEKFAENVKELEESERRLGGE